MYYQVFIARKVVLKLRYVLSSVHCKESCFKLAVCIIKCSLQGKLLESSVYIIKCSLQGKLFERCGMYHPVFFARKVVLKLRYVSSSVHCKESCFKVAVYIIKCSLQGKLF